MPTNPKPTGRAKGGLARAESLSPEERLSIARKGAIARWGAKATHKGNFKDEFGFDVECYVLNDEKRTAVISQAGMGDALGLVSTSSDRVHRLLGSQTLAPYVSRELSERLKNPLCFKGCRPSRTFLRRWQRATTLRS